MASATLISTPSTGVSRVSDVHNREFREMMQNVIGQSKQWLHDLKAQMQGRIIAQGDESYENARKVWNGAVDHHPAAVAFCESTEDVQAAVRTVRTHNIPLSVRSRGYDASGRAVSPNALVIDLSLLNDVQIDGQVATIAGGATAGKVIAAAAASNLMAVTGWNGRPGMTGLATVGGYGPLIASHGLALDSLTGAELVLADGQRVTVDQDQNPDLLWALRGGGGNFGVVTSMKVRMHRARPVLSGMILFPWADAETVLARYAETIGTVSNNLSVVIGIISLPDGNPALFLALAWTGKISDGEIAIGRLQRFGTPVHANIAPTNCQDLAQSFDARVANDRHYAVETRWIPALNPASISALIAGGASRTSPFSMIILQHFRGVPTQVLPDATAFGLRRAHLMVELIASWDPAAGDNRSAHKRWARDLSQSMAPIALPGGYPNLLGPHAQDQIAHAYGSNTTRLRAVKRQFDPDGVFSATPIPS
jgi:FAD/FMN-containing dehydrogenase